MQLAASQHTVSVMVIKVYDGIQMPVYYVSKTLLDAETRYLPLEKVALALIYSVYVLTELLLQALLRRSNFIGITAKWGATLGAFDIRYIYWKTLLPSSPPRVWLYVGYNKSQPIHGEYMWRGRQSPKGIRMEHSLRMAFQASTYEAEYEALLVGF